MQKQLQVCVCVCVCVVVIVVERKVTLGLQVSQPPLGKNLKG